MRVAYVYANPRASLAAAVERGEAPDTGLLGQNHLAALGIEAHIHSPRLRRRDRAGGLVHRVTWAMRELSLPWELRETDLVCTPLGTLLPLAARLRRSPRTVVLNINFCTALERLDVGRRRLLAASLRSAHAIVCFAESQRSRLLEQTGADPARVHVALLGVDDHFYAPGDGDNGYVLAVGRDLGRDYATFATAMRELDRPGVLVASPRNLVDVLLPPNVEVRLDVSAVELRALYAHATCVVIPTRSQEFALGADCSGQTVLLDAMASGKVTVATARTTLAGYIQDGVTATTVPAGDPIALAAALDAVTSDAALRSRGGAAARRLVDERFTTRHFAGRLARIFEQVAA